jgi:hypothetical protein
MYTTHIEAETSTIKHSSTKHLKSHIVGARWLTCTVVLFLTVLIYTAQT